MEDERIAVLARLVIELQAVTEGQSELIARLFAIVAGSYPAPAEVVAKQRRDEERVAYAAAVLPGDDASDRLLAVMARKADAKRAVFDLAVMMIDTIDD